jgi:uncharacterized membrane protein YoaT (DUF817 family)
MNPLVREIESTRPESRKGGWMWEFWRFGVLQARACVFAGAFLAVLLTSRYVSIPGLARPDFILLAALTLQAALLLGRVETLAEAGVLAVFHALGLGLELFKTHPAIRAWTYPELGRFSVGTVPLYSGFMYAAVASYMCQAWRVLRLRLTHYPPRGITLALCLAIYVNFFTHHWLADIRWWLAGGVLVAFARTRVHFTVLAKERSMPLALSFGLIGFFVWVAENISTFLGAWVYPHQQAGWAIVSTGKISAWALLVILTFVLVAELKHYREGNTAVKRSAGDR